MRLSRMGKGAFAPCPPLQRCGGHAEPVIGRAFARPVGFAHPTILLSSSLRKKGPIPRDISIANRVRGSFSGTEAGGYGSLLSQGRRRFISPSSTRSPVHRYLPSPPPVSPTACGRSAGRGRAG